MACALNVSSLGYLRIDVIHVVVLVKVFQVLRDTLLVRCDLDRDTGTETIEGIHQVLREVDRNAVIRLVCRLGFRQKEGIDVLLVGVLLGL